MKRAWRWTIRIALGVIGFVVLALAVTIGTLHTSWGRERVRRIAEQELRAAFPGSTIGRIDGSLFGDLIAREVTLVGRDHRPLVTVDKLTLVAALRPLVGKTVRVDTIVADGVVVYARDQGPEPPEPPQPPSPEPSEPTAWSIELPTIQVRDARVEIETATGVERIDGLGAGISLSLRAGEPLIASVHATATWREQPIAITALVQSGATLAVPYATISLGSARVNVAALTVDGTTIAGSVIARAPAALVEQLAAVELPGDAEVVAALSPSGQLELEGTLGTASLKLLAKTDLERQSVYAIVAADVPDLAVLVPEAPARATVVATLFASPTKLDGIVAVAGDADGHAGTAMLGLDATLERATLVAHGTGVGWTFGASLDIASTGETWTLTRSQIVARARDLDPMRGEIRASIAATGPLSPEPALTVTGTIDGRGLRYDDVSIARVHTKLAATNVPARPRGSLQVDASGIRQGTLAIPVAALGARGILLEDGTIEIDLGGHRVRTADGVTWTGRGGKVRVTDTSIAATGLATGSGTSRITAQALIGRTTDALRARASVRDVPVSMVDKSLGGTLAADIDVARDRGLWKGTVTADASQIALPSRPVIDGKLVVKIDKRHVTAIATASNPAIGSATLDLDVVGPADITDPHAWKRLERSAIQNVRVALSQIDASKLGGSGKLDGELAIFASGAGGKVELRGVETSVGTVDSQLALATAARGDIATRGTLHLGGVDPVEVTATLALPQHPFDPDGWAQLGRETLREATIEAHRIAFDPDLMKRFGVDSPWRGWAALRVRVGPGARSSDFTVEVHELRDGPLTKPLELVVAGGSDAGGVRAEAKIQSGKVGLSVAAKSPISVEAMLAGNALAAPIDVVVTVPDAPARDVALLVGRDDVLAGTVSGMVKLEGTLAEPIARARLAVANVSVAAGLTRKPPTLERLELDARWLGKRAGFELELTGHEAGGRLLKISARGQPGSPESVVASIEAGNFDISPFVAFAPPGHPAIGMRGLVTGVLKLKGLDPNTGDIKGRLVISEARVPLSPELGNLRQATLEIDVLKKEIVTTLDGKINRGTIKGKAIARLTGSMPTAVELSLAIRKVALLGEIQPQLDADISGYFVRTRSKWTGKIAVKNGNVYVPPEGGNELLITGTPGDIVFIDAQPIVVKKKRKPPTAPWLFADIDIQPTKILVDDTNFRFDGLASGKLALEVGDGIGLDGTIATEKGAVDVLGRRYRLDHGIVDFEGSLDPRLDIQMMHGFRSMTLTVDIRGRASEPDLRLSSDVGGYSQSQLLSFLAGATPSDDPASQSSDAVASGSLAVLSSRLGRRINQRLPLLKFDTINYEAKTASSSRAIRVGKRLSDRTYLNYRQRFEPRTDENRSEAVLEYELRQNILVEGVGGERAVGADIMWRKRW
jgi:hypothetical protein